MSTIIRLKADKKRPDKNGNISIYVYISIDGKRKHYPTNLKTKKQYFDENQGQFTGPKGQTERLNYILSNEIKKYQDAVFEIRQRNLDVTHEAIQKIIKQPKTGNLIEYAKQYNWSRRKAIAYKTFQQYEFAYGVLEQYNNTLTLTEVTAEEVRKLRSYLQLKDYKPNTIKIVLSALRNLVLHAISEGLLKDNPFQNITIGKSQEGSMEYLTEQEIRAIEDVAINDLPQRCHNTYYHFLHACYTGLRAVDQRRFKPDEHAKDGFIEIEMQKVSNTVRVPLNDKAKALHNKLQKPLKQSHSRIGEELQQIMNAAGIEKHITFHCARHTFAINSLVKGVPIEVVSKWLGHSSLTTTQIYAKVVDILSTEEMKKWNTAKESFLKVDIVKQGNEYFPVIEVEGKPFGLPLTSTDRGDLKRKVLVKLSHWFSD